MRSTGATSARATATIAAIADLADEATDAVAFLHEVRTRVARVVPTSQGAWILSDPQTLMPAAVVNDDGVDRELARLFFEHELQVPDISGFVDLHRRGEVVTTLYEATGGRPQISARYRDIHEPRGMGDELRVLFGTGSATWGYACVARAADEGRFDEDERAWMRDLAGEVARGLRRALARPPAEPQPVAAPGMLVLDEYGGLEFATGEAHRWLAQLHDDGSHELPPAVLGVALQARAEACAAGAAMDVPAQARVRLPSGAWLHVHAAVMRDGTGERMRIAVMLEPADRAQLVPVLVHVHGLTEREREVCDLLVAGLPIDEIAARLSISRHTLRDHVKAIFAKVGVVSRPELTARFLPAVA